MRIRPVAIAATLLLPLAAAAQQGGVYKWTDEDGNIFYGDHPPPEARDYKKEVKNPRGVTIATIDGKKTEEELAAERAAAEAAMQRELQLRADRALLATYLTVDEIEMHRDRRIELFQAQARVTELYLRNLRRRYSQLEEMAQRYRPYNSDPAAATIDPGLVDEIEETEATIQRHEKNLLKYKAEEQQIFDRFEGDITRFMALKGIDS